MAFKSDTYTVMIAAPNDLSEEVNSAIEVINRWNAVNSADEAAVLIPQFWKSDAVPEAGMRGQEAVNRQLVDRADVLIALFWTRIGESTGSATSGSIEEIERCVAAGKPVMIYFSKRLIDPNKIDLGQQQKIREFKNDKMESALFGEFSDIPQLCTMLNEHLTKQVRWLRKKTHATEVATQMPQYQEQHAIKANADHLAFEASLKNGEFHGFKAERAILAVTVFPVSMSSQPLSLGHSTTLTLMKYFQPLGIDGLQPQPKRKSVILADQIRTGVSRATELTSEGRVFSCLNLKAGEAFYSEITGTTDQSTPWSLFMDTYQPWLLDSTHRYLVGLTTLGVAGPWFFGLSLLKMKNGALFPSRDWNFRFAGGSATPFEGEDMQTDIAIIPADQDLGNAHALYGPLKQPLKELWRQSGYMNLPVFEPGGTLTWIE